MLTATVIGSVWATRRLAELPNGAFLEVEAEGTGQRLIAFDVLGSGVGERVLVTQGSVAAAWFAGKPPPVDALIIGSIDPDPSASEQGTLEESERWRTTRSDLSRPRGTWPRSRRETPWSRRRT
jgi:ethanolamine utilization protein EutN